MSGQITIRVYRVDPATGKRTTVRTKTADTGGAAFPFTLLDRWPLCECPQAPHCRRRERELVSAR